MNSPNRRHPTDTDADSSPGGDADSSAQPSAGEGDSAADDVQNDAVIGRAFWLSLLPISLLVVGGIVVAIVMNRSDPGQEEIVKDVTLPNTREVVEESIPAIPMADISVDSGIDFVHVSGRAGEKLLPETMGSGVAVFDFNNDGNNDLFFVNSSRWPWDIADTDLQGVQREGNDEQEGSTGPTSGEDRFSPDSRCRLYAGLGDGTFRDATEDAGIDFSLYGMGVAIGDFDNDGWRDLFVTAVGQNRLLKNEKGTFRDVTETAFAGDSEKTTPWSTSAAFLDYDNDGLLDLFVCNYVFWSREFDRDQFFTIDGNNRAYGPPIEFPGSYPTLYRNVGDGKFQDVTKSANLEINNPDTGVAQAKSLGVAPVDIDGDGWMDLVVANDTTPNFLLKNQKDGRFINMGSAAGIATDRASGSARGAMGIDTTVFRPDGTVAIGIGNFANEASALYVSRPQRGQFLDAAMATGFGPPTRAALTFGLFFFDADLDGRVDVFGSNGHLEEDINRFVSSQHYAQPPQLFWNAGRGGGGSELVQLTATQTGEDFLQPMVGRGAAFGDFDNDGDCDIVVTCNDGPPKLFRNDQASDHHWLRFALTGTSCNRDAIGAAVSIVVDGIRQTKVVMPTRSYLSQSELNVTFGLGDADAVSECTVQWPGGESQTVQVDAVDQLIRIVQP